MTPPTKTEDEGLVERLKASLADMVRLSKQGEDSIWRPAGRAIVALNEAAARITSPEGELEEARKNLGSYKDMLANADIAAQNAETALSTFKQRASVEEIARVINSGRWSTTTDLATNLHAQLFPSEKNNG